MFAHIVCKKSQYIRPNNVKMNAAKFGHSYQTIFSSHEITKSQIFLNLIPNNLVHIELGPLDRCSMWHRQNWPK